MLIQFLLIRNIILLSVLCVVLGWFLFFLCQLFGCSFFQTFYCYARAAWSLPVLLPCTAVYAPLVLVGVLLCPFCVTFFCFPPQYFPLFLVHLFLSLGWLFAVCSLANVGFCIAVYSGFRCLDRWLVVLIVGCGPFDVPCCRI